MNDQELANSQVEEVLKAARIVDIIGDYIKLRPSGKRFTGVCPFHGDKDPSFSVNPEKGLWYCFGCREGGNVFTFIKKIENVEFGEALQLVARRSGVVLKSRAVNKEMSERERLMTAVKLMAAFYHEQLATSEGASHAREYLRKRNINAETIKLFGIGYAPRGRQNALYHLRGRGFSAEEAEHAGIVMKTHDTGELVDYFRNRITIPIVDAQGRFIGMGGRNLEESGPKYLNSPETSIFSKGKNLFGLYQAKKAIGREDCAIVVEGYMDQMQLFQQGFHHVVASLGTSITLDQAKLLGKFCSGCILAYDSDQAGQMATVKGIDVFEEAGITPKVLILPPGEDPDSLARKTSPEELKKILKGTHSLIDFKIVKMKESVDLATPEGKSRFILEVFPLVNEIRDPIKKDEYVKQLASETGVKEDLIRGTQVGKKSLYHSQVGSLSKLLSSTSAEEKLMSLILLYPECLEKVREHLTIADITEAPLRPVFEVLFSMYGKKTITVEDFIPCIHDEGITNKITELIMAGEAPPYSEQSVLEYIRLIKDEKLKTRFKELKKEVERLLSQNNIDRQDERFVEYQRLRQYFKGFNGIK